MIELDTHYVDNYKVTIIKHSINSYPTPTLLVVERSGVISVASIPPQTVTVKSIRTRDHILLVTLSLDNYTDYTIVMSRPNISATVEDVIKEVPWT